MIRASLLALFTLILAFAGCRSPRLDVTIQNHTGSAIDLLEVDYPSASFGLEHLDLGAAYHYRIQTRGSGPLLMHFTEAATHAQRQISGPTLQQGQSGELHVELLPGGKANFQ
ncbi:MAG TPA: hypothetical protein VN151_08590 [Terracidiphilus sp.]|nr:hypothetical protein [Terracidiphilus sp.]